MILPEEVNLLYIEDNTENAEIILEFLALSRFTKFNVIHKDTLQKGLDYLDAECKMEETCNIDVILLDLILPDSRSGIDTYKIVSKNCDFIPIVIVSGHEEMACECVRMGAQDYLYKPEFNAGTLARSLKYAIERSRLVSNLEESERRFRNLVEVTGAAIYEIDFINGKFIYVNDVMCKQTGYNREELYNLGPADILSRDSLKEWLRRWEKFKKEGIYEGPFEYEIIKKDGSKIWGLIVSEFIKDNDKVTITVNVVAIDITKQKLIEESLKKKEEVIFNELESKIHQWKSEITGREYEKLKIMDNQITSLYKGTLSIG